MHPTSRYPFRVLQALLLSVLLVCSGLAAAPAAPPADARANVVQSTFTVTSTADTDGSVCNTNCTLRQAINAANAAAGADIIQFSLPTPSVITLTTSLPAITGTLTIYGLWWASDLAISGNNLYRVLTVNSGASLALNDVTITGGHAASGHGGGIDIAAGGTLSVTNCAFANNSASGSGGAIHNGGGSLTITGVTFSNNQANYGGAIDSNGSLSVSDSTFDGNTATNGGGAINNYNSLSNSVVITNSTFYSNTAVYGGGVRNDHEGTLNIINNTFFSNTASEAGGVNNYIGTINIANSTFFANSASSTGGSLSNSEGILNVTNSTFSSSSASSSATLRNFSGTTILRNSILANSGGSNCQNDAAGTLNADSYNLASDGTCAGATVTTTAALQLGPLQDNGGNTQTIALLSGSSAIDAGNDGSCPALDQRGVRRPQGAHCDVGAFEAVPQTLVVNNAADTDDGLCTSANCTLREAITASNNGIPGVAYTVSFSLTTPAVITLTTSLPSDRRNLVIQGPGASSLSISGNNAVRVLYVNSGASLALSGVTVRQGYANQGGGIYNSGTLTVTNSTIVSNTATYGGGIENYGTLTVTNTTIVSNTATYGGGIENGGTLTVTNSTIVSNTATSYGGGIYNDYGTSLTVINSTLASNTADYGGGIYNTEGALNVTHSTFASNTAHSGGGAINNYHSIGYSVEIANSTFYSNTAVYGGGVRNDHEGTLNITNSTFFSNTASEAGGVNNYIGTTNIANSTFFANSASSTGGSLSNSEGILNVTNSTFSSSSASSSATLRNFSGTTILRNSILANSGGSNCQYAVGTLIADHYNLASDGTCAGATVTTTTALRLGPLQDNGGKTQTIALLAGSSAIDTGDDAACAAAPVNNLDQRGVARPQGTHCDVGAFEAVPQTLVVNKAADTDDGLCTSADCTLREAINAGNNGIPGVAYTVAFSLTTPAVITLTNSLPAVNHNLAILGPGASNLSISGNNAVRVLSVNSGASLALSGVTVRQGYATFGGGIYNSGTLTVTNSTIVSNTATTASGGGINNDGTLSVANSTFANNTGSSGGGIYSYFGTLTVINSTIVSNTAAWSGGGIYNVFGTLTVTNGTFVSNTAADGGGIDNYSGTLTVTNGTFVSNTAADGGGGIYRSGGTATLRNTLLYNTTGSNCGGTGTVTASTDNQATDATCAGATVTTTTALRLGPLQNNGGNTQTIALLSGSSAIDAGNDGYCPATDQRGVTRPQGAHCDVGAYEFELIRVFLPLVRR